MLGSIVNYARNLFSRSGTTGGSILSNVAKGAASSVYTKAPPAKLDLGPERVSQATLNNPNKIYACNITSHMLITQVLGAVVKTLDEFYNLLLKKGAIRPDCFIVDYNLIPKAVGLKGYTFRKANVDANLIYNNLINNRPMHVYVGGHFEMIRGFEYKDQKLLFLVNDPGFQGDTHIDSTTWELFHYEGDKRKNSKNKDGTKRKAVSVGWYATN